MPRRIKPEKRTVKFNSAETIASLKFSHAQKPWGKIYPPKKMRDDMVSKMWGGDWKKGFIVYDSHEYYKYPFVDRTGKPRFEGLMAAFRRAMMVLGSPRVDDPIDKKTARRVARIIIQVLEKWKNSRDKDKRKFAEEHLDEYKQSLKEAGRKSKVSESAAFPSEALIEMYLIRDLAGAVRSALALHQPTVKLKKSVLSQEEVEPVAEERVLSEAKKIEAAIKQLYSALSNAPRFEFAHTPEQFVKFLQEIKKDMKEDDILNALQKIKQMFLPYFGKLIGGAGMEPHEAAGKALNDIARALENIKLTKKALGIK